MKTRIHPVSRSFLMVATLWAAGLGSQLVTTAAGEPPRFSHPRDITHPYLPLGTLKQDILAGKEGSKSVRVERTAKPELHKIFQVGSQTVQALVVEDRETENGQLAEIALDYFAQADDGTVYYLGEDVDEYKNGKVVGHSGAWLYGLQTQQLGVLLPAHPKVGQNFRSEDVPRITTEDDTVMSLSETVAVPAGTYRHCLKIREKLSDGATEYKFYAPGVGCIKEVPEEGAVELQSHTPKATPAGPAAGPARSVQGATAKPPIQDPTARVALSLVGADPVAEEYWMWAINDPGLPAQERQDLIEDLNEDGLSDPQHPAPEDLPLIMSRLELIEDLAPSALDQVNANAFQEAHKDLVNLAELAQGRGKPVP